MRSSAKVLMVFVALLLIRATPCKMFDVKLASYSIGEANTPGYEEFGFWLKNGQRAEIDYSYGTKPIELKIHYLDKVVSDGQNGFKARFSNGLVLFFIPDGIKLRVFDVGKKYDKTFLWKYEGPVNGIGTYCDACARDDNEAMEIIKRYYLK